MTIIIILGHRILKDGSMSHSLINRLKLGHSLYKKGDSIMLTGGRVQTKSKHTEAYLMKKYLLQEYEIPSKSIITEPRAMTTIENAIYSYKILTKINHIGDCDIIILSSNFHIKRVKYIFNKILVDIPNKTYRSSCDTFSRSQLLTIKQVERKELKRIKQFKKLKYA